MDITGQSSLNHAPSSTWIENLALQEINMDESGIIDLDDHLTPEAYLEESSIQFMNSVRDKIEYFVSKFNQFRAAEGSSHHIKIFKISNTINDFMLFRNSLRLIFSRKADDLIQVAFLSNGQELFAPRTSLSDRAGTQSFHEIKAEIGAFNKITWKFQGDPVDIEAMVRHYLNEFIKVSAR